MKNIENIYNSGFNSTLTRSIDSSSKRMTLGAMPLEGYTNKNSRFILENSVTIGAGQSLLDSPAVTWSTSNVSYTDVTGTDLEINLSRPSIVILQATVFHADNGNGGYLQLQVDGATQGTEVYVLGQSTFLSAYSVLQAGEHEFVLQARTDGADVDINEATTLFYVLNYEYNLS